MAGRQKTFTFVKAVKEKYVIDQGFDPNLHVISYIKPRKKGNEEELPSVVDLTGLNLSCVGEVEEMRGALGHVKELHMSNNEFSSWTELEKLFNKLPFLQLLDLSKNPLTHLEIAAEDDEKGDEKSKLEINGFYDDTKHDIDNDERNYGKKLLENQTSFDEVRLPLGSGTLKKQYAMVDNTAHREDGEMEGLTTKITLNNLQAPTSQNTPKSTKTFFSKDGTTHPKDGTTHPKDGTTHLKAGTAYPKDGSTSPKNGSTHQRNSFTHLRNNSLCLLPPRLITLVLNSTLLSIVSIFALLSNTPNLQELHIGSNKLSTFPFDQNRFPSVTQINLANNFISDWSEIEKLGQVFPNLTSLVLSGNPLSRVASRHSNLSNLKKLVLSNSLINDISNLHQLNQLPQLHTLKITSVPLYQNMSEVVRRKLIVASLQKVSNLNGSQVAQEERVEAESFYVTFYSSEDEKPMRYDELKEKYRGFEKNEKNASPPWQHNVIQYFANYFTPILSVKLLYYLKFPSI